MDDPRDIDAPPPAIAAAVARLSGPICLDLLISLVAEQASPQTADEVVGEERQRTHPAEWEAVVRQWLVAELEDLEDRQLGGAWLCLDAASAEQRRRETREREALEATAQARDEEIPAWVLEGCCDVG